MSSDHLISLKNVYKTYFSSSHEVHALNGINIEIPSQKVIALLGPSGSGKSTLLYILGLLTKPSNGEMMINGQNVSSWTENQIVSFRKKFIGFIFQSFHLLPRLTAFENVKLPLIYLGMKKKEAEKRVENILSKLQLANRMNHFPNQLSGGEQQRVAIGRALVTNPKLIVADEPTGNLDQKTGQDLMDILIELKNEGKTVFIVTHDQNVANQADIELRIEDGKI